MRNKIKMKKLIIYLFVGIMTFFCMPVNNITVHAATEWTFSYTGSIQEWTCPSTGTYILEVYGAAGGDAGIGGKGGLGGYSKGNITLTAGTKLYIVVGGKGADGTQGDKINYGGYNGGGNGKTNNTTSLWITGGGGGGATHIATKTGLLSSLSTSKSSILIVAGGGGGGSYKQNSEYTTPVVYKGGSGGGQVGGAGQGDSTPSGGTQTSGGTAPFANRDGTFGQGGGGYEVGGGGGYYGGAGTQTSTATCNSASGGSGYIGGVTGGSTSNGIRTGNGYAKITALHTHSYTSSITTTATCTTTGVRTYTCVCGNFYTETIDALGHLVPTEYAYETNNDIENGEAYKNCERCDARLETKWLNRIRVRYQNTDATYGEYTDVVNSYNEAGEEIEWSRTMDDCYQDVEISWTSIAQAKSEDVSVDRKKVTLKLNSWLDGERKDNLSNFATADVYINGTQVANDIDEYYNTELLYGAEYEIKDIKPKAGYSYNGIHTGTDSLSGTLNGSKSIEPEFTTNSYTVSLTTGTGISSVSGGGTYRYGANVEIDASVKPGYTWAGWNGTCDYEDANVTFTMPAEDIDITATATANTDTPYMVRHWKQNLDGGDDHTAANYTIADTDNLEGTTDTSVTPDVKTYEGFTSPSTIAVNVDGDGSRVVDYYYTRNSYTVSLTAGTGISSVSGGGTYRYGASVEINAELITEPPYQFVKWEGTEGYESTENQRTITIPAHDISLTAKAKLVSCDSLEATYTTPVEVGQGIDISDIHITATYSNETVADITGNSSLLFVNASGNRVTTIVKKEAGLFTFDILYLFNGFETYGTVDVTFTDTITPTIGSVVYDNNWTQELPITYTVSDNSSGPLKYFMAYERQYTQSELSAERMQNMNPGELTLTLHDNGTYYFYVVDPSGNMTWNQVEITCIDDVPPVVIPWITYQENKTDKKILPAEQVLGDVQYITFEIDAQDAETSVKQYRYKRENEEWSEWKTTNTFPGIYLNGTYEFEVEDICGNVGTASVRLFMMSQSFEVHYLDVDQNGTILCDTIKRRPLNASVSGAELGTKAETGEYYEGYDYISCDTAVVYTTGATVHRYFKIHEYTVNYHDESGSIIASQKIPYGNTSSINQNMEKEGYEVAEGSYSYIFKGWGTKDGTLVNTTEVKKDMELYPVYELVFTEGIQQNDELYVVEAEMPYNYREELENLDITAVGTEPEYIEQVYETTSQVTEQAAEQEQLGITFISDEKTALGKLIETLNTPQLQKITQTTAVVTGTAIGITLLSVLMQIFTGAGLLQSIIFGYVLLRKKVRYVRGAWMLSEEGVKYVDKYGRKLEVEDNGKQTVFKRKGKILYSINVEELITKLQTGRISYSQFEEQLAKSEVYTAFSRDVGIEVYNVKAQSGQVKKKMVGFNLSGNIKNMMKGLGEYTVRINNSGKQIVFDVKYAIQNA